MCIRFIDTCYDYVGNLWSLAIKLIYACTQQQSYVFLKFPFWHPHAYYDQFEPSQPSPTTIVHPGPIVWTSVSLNVLPIQLLLPLPLQVNSSVEHINDQWNRACTSTTHQNFCSPWCILVGQIDIRAYWTKTIYDIIMMCDPTSEFAVQTPVCVDSSSLFTFTCSATARPLCVAYNVCTTLYNYIYSTFPYSHVMISL